MSHRGTDDHPPSGVILLIESDAAQAQSMRTELMGQGFEVLWSSSHLKALSILEDRKDLDIVLVMAEPTDIGGFDFIHILRHRNRFADRWLQVVVIASGESFEKFPSHLAGIDDYLLRPYFPGELTWRVNKAIHAIRAKRHQSATQLLDQYSGILTPAGIEQVIHEELNKIFRKKGVLSIILFRLHGLEAIGLSHGKMMAEWMERDLSTAIRASLRSYDRLGALEGGEYCLVAPDVSVEHLPMLSQRLIQCVRDWNINVARHSHIQIPIMLALRSIAVHPDCQPAHLHKAAKIFWEWMQQIRTQANLPDGQVLQIRLTEKSVECCA